VSLRATEGSEAISYEKNTDFLFKEICSACSEQSEGIFYAPRMYESAVYVKMYYKRVTELLS